MEPRCQCRSYGVAALRTGGAARQSTLLLLLVLLLLLLLLRWALRLCHRCMRLLLLLTVRQLASQVHHSSTRYPGAGQCRVRPRLWAGRSPKVPSAAMRRRLCRSSW